MITLLICVTLIILAAISAVFLYFKDKNDKIYNEYCNSLSDIIEDISYHVSLIKEDEIFGDIKIHIKNIKRLCNKVQNEIEETVQKTEES